jgi:hypothetical protein
MTSLSFLAGAVAESNGSTLLLDAQADLTATACGLLETDHPARFSCIDPTSQLLIASLWMRAMVFEWFGRVVSYFAVGSRSLSDPLFIALNLRQRTLMPVVLHPMTTMGILWDSMSGHDVC